VVLAYLLFVNKGREDFDVNDRCAIENNNDDENDDDDDASATVVKAFEGGDSFVTSRKKERGVPFSDRQTDRQTDRDDADDVLDVVVFRTSGRNDVDVARVVQSRPPPRGEETKTLLGVERGRRRRDAPSPRLGGGGVFARRGVLGVLGLVLFERTYEAARYPGIIDSTSPRDWCRMQRQQEQRVDRERRKEHKKNVRAVRPRQNATTAATEEMVPIETTRGGCRCRRELRPSDR